MIETILTRRSVRKYNGKPIESEKLDAILKCAIYAPSAKNTKPWRFVLSSNRGVLDEIMRVHPYAAMLDKASSVILVCGDSDVALEGYLPVDCSAAAENILLAAHSLGIGSCWLGIYPREERIGAMRNLFALPSNIQPIALIALGYYDEQPRQPERTLDKYVHTDKW